MNVATRHRVVLRPATQVGFETVHEWYAEAARVAFEERSLDELLTQRSSERGLRPIILGTRWEPIGLLEYRQVGDCIVFPFIALAKPYRGWGYGSEAVRLLEERALRDGIAHLFGVDVDVRNGPGLYFWLRLGYRPAGKGEFDWQPEDARDKMPMVRVPNDV